MGLTNPAPGGMEGRTDQGVDWSNIRGNIGAVGGGVIQTVYAGLSGFGTTIIEKLNGTNEDIYYGLETGGGTPVVRAGQRVRAGQPLAPGLGKGGIEVGIWNPATGRALGAPGYYEGKATAAGATFRRAIRQPGARATPASAPFATPATSLAGLWIAAGGPVSQANTAAAVAMAESRGKVNATNKNNNGTIDRGIWQINSVHSQFDPSRLLSDPEYNASAAVAVWRSQGWGAWTTYNTGAYKAFLPTATTATAAFTGITRPGGQPVPSGGGSSGGGSGGGSSGGGDPSTVWASYTTELQGNNGPQFVSTSSGSGGILDGLNPINLFGDIGSVFRDSAGTISDGVSFLKWVSWIFHPRNILRVIEFVTGMLILLFGVQAITQGIGERREGFDTSEGALSRSGLGRVSRELARGVTAGKRPAIPRAAPHRVRREALRVRYQREQRIYRNSP